MWGTITVVLTIAPTQPNGKEKRSSSSRRVPSGVSVKWWSCWKAAKRPRPIVSWKKAGWRKPVIRVSWSWGRPNFQPRQRSWSPASMLPLSLPSTGRIARVRATTSILVERRKQRSIGAAMVMLSRSVNNLANVVAPRSDFSQIKSTPGFCSGASPLFAALRSIKKLGEVRCGSGTLPARR